MPSEDRSLPVANRHEFVLLYDVADGNPNGDPDAGNAPRVDPETGQGLVTDVCLKRKLRNYVQLAQVEGEDFSAKPGYEIYVKHRGILAAEQRRAYAAEDLRPDGRPATVQQARAWMCRTFFDVRAFGAVMGTGKVADEDDAPAAAQAEGRPAGRKPPGAQKLWNCGQVRGPVQLSFSRSVEPIVALEHAITRVALTNADDIKGGDVSDATAAGGQFGRKSTVPYGLYRAHGFVSPALARDTGFSGADLEVLWAALGGMFEHDRSSGRGGMAARRLVVFEHATALGDHPAHKLFELVSCVPAAGRGRAPARCYADYKVTVKSSPTAGVRVLEKI
jgi:CRISPR-associated protein Csd2